MKALTAAEAREVDRLTTERYSVSALTLMENAGTCAAEFIREKFPRLEGRRIVVLCGKGNNGGDGFVIARKLHEMGARTAVFSFASADEMRGDAAVNRKRWQELGGELRAVTDTAGLAAVKAAIESVDGIGDVIVDALLGTGTCGPVEGVLREAIEAVNRRGRGQTVVAVDIPSGAPADSGDVPSGAVQADYTVTFTAPKVGMLSGKSNACCGEMAVREIGSPRELIEEVGKGHVRWSEPGEFADFGVRRKAQGNKGDYGHALVVAGSVGKSGAAVLASWSALRAGAGLVTLATPEPVLPVVAAHIPEVMTEPLPPTETGSISLRSLDHDYFDSVVKGKRSLAIGPGLSTHRETQEFVRAVVGKRALPIILDADGLNAFAGRAAELNDPRGRLAITPHPGEMARLLGSSASEVQSRRMEVARKAASDWNCVAILKGHQTIMAAPDGSVWVNSTGNPGMGTGGTGDVLTGMLAGLTAQYPETEWGKVLSFGVYLHGLAGDLAYRGSGEAPLMASDLIRFIPHAYRHFYSEMGRG
jgi:ADP-dependent NAD(P)H-hydrate dehydratase / NAD(P)H-hydrate epimerase